MENSTGRLLYNLHWDRDYALDLIDTWDIQSSVIQYSNIEDAKRFFLSSLLPPFVLLYSTFSSKAIPSVPIFDGDTLWIWLGWRYRGEYILWTNYQIALSLHEFNFCFLYRLQLVVPYAAFYCEGPICRIGLPMNVLMVGNFFWRIFVQISSSTPRYIQVYMAFSMVASIPTFLYILLRMHHKIVLNTNTTFIFSKR